MDNVIYFHAEPKNDPTIIGFKNYSNLELGYGVIGSDDPTIPDKLNIKFYNDIKLINEALQQYIMDGYRIVSFNGTEYSNGIVAAYYPLSAEDYLSKEIGGTKGSTLWKDIDDGYLTFLIQKKVGQYEIAQTIYNYRQDMLNNTSNDKSYTTIKKMYDDNSIDLFKILKDKKVFGTFLSNLADCTVSDNMNTCIDFKDLFTSLKTDKIQDFKYFCGKTVVLIAKLYKFIKLNNYLIVPMYNDVYQYTKNMVIKVPINICNEEVSK